MYDKLIAVVGGIVAPKLISALTARFKLKDFWAWSVASAVYTVFALFILAVTGGLSFEAVTWESFSGLVVIVLTVAHSIFQYSKKED